jgi:hypothetical protein
MGFFLGCMSVCELAMSLIFLLSIDSVELFWSVMVCILCEPIGCYVFTGYIAMRRVSTVSHLTAMMFTLPFYYLLLQLNLVLRRDLHQVRVLSKLIYFNFSELAFRRLMIVHLAVQTGPCMCLVLCALLFTEGNVVLSLCALGVACLSACVYLMVLGKQSVPIVYTSLDDILATEHSGDDDLDLR